jgi:hypothetical protein
MGNIPLTQDRADQLGFDGIFQDGYFDKLWLGTCLHSVNFELKILGWNQNKNRGLEWNVKDKDTTNREMDAGCALIDAGYRAREFNAPPEIPGGAFLAGRFIIKPDAYGVSFFFFAFAFS